MNRRVPRPLSAALAELTSRLEPASTLATVQRCWEDVVGAPIAVHATPTAAHDGVLQIACDDAVWAAELDLLGPSLVAALNAAIGAEALSSVRVRADRPRTARRKRS